MKPTTNRSAAGLMLTGIRSVGVIGLVATVLLTITSFDACTFGVNPDSLQRQSECVYLLGDAMVIALVSFLLLLHWRMILIRRWAVLGSCIIGWLLTGLFAAISAGAAMRTAGMSPERGELYGDLVPFFFTAAFAAGLTAATVVCWRQLRSAF